MTNQEIYKIVSEQLAIDYNCPADDFYRDGVIFTEAQKLEGRRAMPFHEPRLEIITMGRGTVVNASKNIMPPVKRHFEGKSRYEILTSPLVYGVNPYYLPDITNLKHMKTPLLIFSLLIRIFKAITSMKVSTMLFNTIAPAKDQRC